MSLRKLVVPAIVVALLGPFAASAQQQLDPVIVVGTRGSLESAIERKRNSNDIVDSVVASEIYKLPDLSVADAVQRITELVNRNPGVFSRGFAYGNISGEAEEKSDGTGLGAQKLLDEFVSVVPGRRAGDEDALRVARHQAATEIRPPASRRSRTYSAANRWRSSTVSCFAAASRIWAKVDAASSSAFSLSPSSPRSVATTEARSGGCSSCSGRRGGTGSCRIIARWSAAAGCGTWRG
jgi:hypothetical protein